MPEELPIQPADPHSPIPLYFQVENDLRRLIYEDRLPAGSIVPPEHELSKMYQVSRHTVRQALSRMEHDDLISRGAGRGTIVKTRKDLTTLSVARSFTAEMQALGYETRSQVLEVTAGIVGDPPIPALAAYKDAPCLNLTRLRFADDEPVCLQHSTILTSQCPDLHKFDFSTVSLYKVLSENYQLYISQIDYSLSAIRADKVTAEQLGVENDAPLLAVSTTASLKDGSIMEYSESHYRADRYHYSISHRLKE